MGNLEGLNCFRDIHRCVLDPGYGDLKMFTIRERMTYVESQMTEATVGLFPFSGAPRPEGFYIEQAQKSMPSVLMHIARIATVLNSIVEEHCEDRDMGKTPAAETGPRLPRFVEKGGSHVAPSPVPRKQIAKPSLESGTRSEEKVA
jgi:hypothetical protein